MSDYRFGGWGRVVGFWVLVVSLLLMPAVAHQALVPCDPLGSSVPDPTTECSIDDLLEIPVAIFNWLLGLAALVLVAVLGWSGTRMMLYYISEVPEAELEGAKNTLRRGIFGFLIVIGAYLIVNTLVFVLLGLSAGSRIGIILDGFGIKP